MKRRTLSVLIGGLAVFALLGGQQASAKSPTQYDSKNFYCTSTKTNAAVKMWEYGKSGVMQFQIKFIAQEYYNGYWHNDNSHEIHSNIFRDSYANHSFGWYSYYFTWNPSNHYHRELVKMIWWHRSPTYVVAHKSLVTRSCR